MKFICEKGLLQYQLFNSVLTFVSDKDVDFIEFTIPSKFYLLWYNYPLTECFKDLDTFLWFIKQPLITVNKELYRVSVSLFNIHIGITFWFAYHYFNKDDNTSPF